MKIKNREKEGVRLDLGKTALILIDLQKESDFGVKGVEDVVPNAKTLIEACRSHNLPIIYTRQINRADGAGLSNGEPLKSDGTPVFYSTDRDDYKIIDELEPNESDVVIDKHRWSAFYETSLDLFLRDKGIEHIIIGGLVTDGCLMTSVFDAYFRNYQVNLVKDICATTNEGAHMSSMLIMSNWVYDIQIYDTQEMVKKLNGEEHHVWKASEPDSLQFTADTLKETFEKLSK